MSIRMFAALALTVLLTGCTYQPLLPPTPVTTREPVAVETEPTNWQELLPGQVATVRQSVARYRDYAVAEREGWQPFGGEEPLMGQHFHNDRAPDYVYGDPIDFTRPNNLMYAEIEGRKVLTGVAYVVRIAADEPVPAGFAGPQDIWHVHDMLSAINAATEERPFLRTLAGWWLDDTYFSQGDDRYRLAMVHVWTEWPNPDGTFASYDRTLPYRKLGLPTAWADGATIEAARGLHLASANGCDDTLGGHAWIADLSRAQDRALAAACERAADDVQAALASGPDILNRVAELAWQDYRETYDAVLTQEQQSRVAAITEHDHGQGDMEMAPPSTDGGHGDH